MFKVHSHGLSAGAPFLLVGESRVYLFYYLKFTHHCPSGLSVTLVQCHPPSPIPHFGEPTAMVTEWTAPNWLMTPLSPLSDFRLMSYGRVGALPGEDYQGSSGHSYVTTGFLYTHRRLPFLCDSFLLRCLGVLSSRDVENRFTSRVAGQHPVQLSSSPSFSRGGRASDALSSVTCCHLWLRLSQMK